jgi:Flp pilus assembly protein TadB
MWLNSVVAREIWNRRTFRNLESSTSSTTSDSSPQQQSAKKEMKKLEERRGRQERLFKVIICLMTVFFICRMPMWIFTIYKLNNDVSSDIYFVLNYALGTVCLLNCALNPYMYTFMSETIKILSFLRTIICSIFNPCRCRKCNNDNS